MIRHQLARVLTLIFLASNELVKLSVIMCSRAVMFGHHRSCHVDVLIETFRLPMFSVGFWHKTTINQSAFDCMQNNYASFKWGHHTATPQAARGTRSVDIL